ncbi:hypothetical protein [Azospirillum canadense]|nr:hypothetical protein [Azospirillum canadense]MCW2243215.1 hypothetical protein [Azospirillum canadense]
MTDIEFMHTALVAVLSLLAGFAAACLWIVWLSNASERNYRKTRRWPGP